MTDTEKTSADKTADQAGLFSSVPIEMIVSV